MRLRASSARWHSCARADLPTAATLAGSSASAVDLGSATEGGRCVSDPREPPSALIQFPVPLEFVEACETV